MDALLWTFLSRTFDAALGWGVGRALDVVTRCTVCSQPDNRRVANKTFNTLECSNCHKAVSQFTNASDTTIDRSTLLIAHAHVEYSEQPWRWEKKTYWLKPPEETLYIPNDIQIMGVCRRTALVDMHLSRVHDGGTIISYRDVFSPCYDNWQLLNWWWRHDISIFTPANRVAMLFTLKLTADSGELLAEHKRYIKPFLSHT